MDDKEFAFERSDKAHWHEFARMRTIFLRALHETTDGAVLEIGVHAGGSSLWWMVLMKDANDLRHMTTIDPYLVIPTEYLETMQHLGRYATNFGMDWRHYLISDRVFCNYVFPTLPENDKTYAFCYLDGPHDHESVVNEFAFFQNKMQKGGVILIDDICPKSSTWEDIKEMAGGGFEYEAFVGHIWLRRK